VSATVTGRDAAAELDVPAKRVAKWIEDGKVRPVGLLPGRSRGGRGVPTFYLDDFRPLAAAYHARMGARV
jgi:hypothetical protein